MASEAPPPPAALPRAPGATRPAERSSRGLDGQVAILALERLYPLPTQDLAAELERYRHVTDVRWVQDEPENQGAYQIMQLHLPAALAAAMNGYELRMTGVTRPEASAPSVGMTAVHKAQEADLFERAFRV